jgi:hypothetical protein
MLDRTTNYSAVPVAPSTCTITGQSISKSSWNPRRRADLAARWKLGAVQVDPTTKLAAMVFGVSVPLVNEAIGDLEARGVKTISPIDSLWTGMTDRERDTLVRRHLLQVWDVVDRVTA